MGIRFEFLRAFNGDCILMSTENSNILIDGGTKKTYNIFLKREIERLRDNGKRVDLVVSTHIDSDHIDGIVQLLENEKQLLEENYIESSIIKKIWFNAFEDRLFSDDFSNDTSYLGYKTFREFIDDMDKNIEYDNHISIDNKIDYLINNEINILLLSPNDKKIKKLHKKYKEPIEEDFYTSYSKDSNKSIEELAQLPFKKDNSEHNGASIAFILEYEVKKYLFLADAHIDLIVESLEKLGYSKDNPLEVEFIKLSHHGSKKNINQKFLDLVRSDNFIILTNGASHGHPDKEALSRIILNPNRNFDKKINFICNYDEVVEDSSFSYEEEEKYNFELICRREIHV
jgi:beta-lactamase superfamily II metal-dependent hydrolase